MNQTKRFTATVTEPRRTYSLFNTGKNVLIVFVLTGILSGHSADINVEESKNLKLNDQVLSEIYYENLNQENIIHIYGDVSGVDTLHKTLSSPSGRYAEAVEISSFQNLSQLKTNNKSVTIAELFFPHSQYEPDLVNKTGNFNFLNESKLRAMQNISMVNVFGP